MQKEAAKLRICNVSYLNATPYRKVSSLPWVDYSEELPSECARKLHEDEADLALIPIADYAIHGGYQNLGYGIAANGPVESVILISNEKIEDLEKIYIDSGSQTAVSMLRLITAIKAPEKLQTLKLYRTDTKTALQSVENKIGALIIGDKALSIEKDYKYRIDLASYWKEQTGLPMVFALWAYKKEKLNPLLREEITSSFKKGLQCKRIFAEEWAEKEKYPKSKAVDYLENLILYKITDDTLKGAEEYLSSCARNNIFPKTTVVDSKHKTKNTDSILSDASAGERISISDAIQLADKTSLSDLTLAASIRQESLHPKEEGISYIIDRNINYTNVCNVYCRFCAFYEAPGKGGYVLSKEEIGQKIKETVDASGIQILLQGGLNPELDIYYYEDLFKWVKQNYPVNLHALSADEILHIAEVSQISVDETISRLISSGLGSLPGAGAESLVDRVRKRIARLKCKAETWLDVHRRAHKQGITSTCTMLFGVGETWEDKVLHMHKLRRLQDETHGFTAFITWPFQDENTKLQKSNCSAPEYLRTQAISRLFLDNIANIQSSWVTQGPSVGQVALEFGANDFGSVMFEENVVSAAGTVFCMNSDLIEQHILDAGFSPWRRDVHYNRA